MRYLALAADYDGTLALDGQVDAQTLEALQRLLASGRKLILVTGRQLEDLIATFPEVHLFERIVAENGALMYRPADHSERALTNPPPGDFIEQLRRRGVRPLSVGRVIVATWEPHQTAVLEVIRELGLELQVIFNKGAVMVLPAGVTKATGLASALAELGLSSHNVVGIGDAENDHSFLRECECSVAVANALQSVQQATDFTTRGDHGVGVAELIDELLAEDLSHRDAILERHHVQLGLRNDETPVFLPRCDQNVLVVGPSGSGKSTLTAGLLERWSAQHYQVCVIDPEGDYDFVEDGVILGSAKQGPSLDEVMQVLEKPNTNAVVNLVGLRITDRPGYFLALLPRLQELRARTGRPHWLVIDESHHLQPASWEPAALGLTQELTGTVRITVRPSLISAAALAAVDTLIVVRGVDP
jgi:hydroxymethylpyrimidine pyrophosphatase-like HAD family hydrolase